MTEVFMAFLLTSAVGTLLAFVLMLLKPFTRKYFSANWNYYTWIVVLFVMVVPFRFNLPVHEVYNTTLEVVDTEENVKKPMTEEIPHVSEEYEVPEPNNITFSPIAEDDAVPEKSILQITTNFLKNNIALFAQLWVIGAIALFMLKIASYKKFLADILQNSRMISCAEIEKYTNEKIEVRACENIQSPFVIRYLNPVLVLPEREITPCELENILAHELTHIKRHDILYKWAVNIVKCIHWFNPVVYIIGKEIDKDCEISCDAQAVKNMSVDKKKAYAETILSLLSAGNTMPLTTGMSGDKKTLKQRFEMIKNSKPLTKKVVIVSAILVVVLSFVIVFVSGMLNGHLLSKEDDYSLNVNKPSEPIEINVISADDLNENPYDKILKKYYKALNEKWDHNKMWNENLCYLAGLSKHENPIENIGYCLMDLNGDEQEELLIGEITDGYWGMVIYDLYVIKNGETYILSQSNERHRRILFEENGVYKIAIEGTESAAKAYTNYYAFNGNSLKFEKAVILDGTKQPESEVFTDFFLAYDDDFNTDNDTPIDQKTATEIMQSYQEMYITPKFIPFATLKEAANLVSEEQQEKIIDEFYAAYDFWDTWVYGQKYRANDDTNYPKVGPTRESVTSDSPIQSVKQLREKMEKHFTKEMTDMFFAQLVPEDKDGKLYLYCGDVGGSAVEFENIVIEQVNAEKYVMKFDRRTFYEDYDHNVMPYSVYYVLEDGKWVFENREEEFFYSHGAAPGYLSKEYAPYNDILRTYYAALWQKWDIDRLNENKLPYMFMYSNNKGRTHRMQTVGYCLMDVNGDNRDELLIGEIVDGVWGQVIYAMYTVKDGSVYQMFESGERQRHTLYKENGKYYIAYEGSGGAAVNAYLYSEIVGYELVTKKIIKQDAFEYPDNPWYEENPEYKTVYPISEETALNIIESYQAKYITPEFIPFETLG